MSGASEQDCIDCDKCCAVPDQALRSRKSAEETVREAARQARALAREAPAAAAAPPAAAELLKVMRSNHDRASQGDLKLGKGQPALP
jgi:hypothetical protein